MRMINLIVSDNHSNHVLGLHKLYLNGDGGSNPCVMYSKISLMVSGIERLE